MGFFMVKFSSLMEVLVRICFIGDVVGGGIHRGIAGQQSGICDIQTEKCGCHRRLLFPFRGLSQTIEQVLEHLVYHIDKAAGCVICILELDHECQFLIGVDAQYLLSR